MSLPQISDAEFEIMNIIWKYAPINKNDLVERLTEGKGWNPKPLKPCCFDWRKKVLSRTKKKAAFLSIHRL